jgi:hypothetical protein
MGRRYSNINQGQILKEAQDALEEYRKTKASSKRKNGGTPGEARPKISLAVKPFDKAGVSIKTSTTKLEGRTVTTGDVFTGATKIAKFRPARIHLFDPNDDNRVYVQSKQTKLYYLKYAGEAYSAPFGCSVDTEEESAAAAALITSVATLSTKQYKRVWYSSEFVPV